MVVEGHKLLLWEHYEYLDINIANRHKHPIS